MRMCAVIVGWFLVTVAGSAASLADSQEDGTAREAAQTGKPVIVVTASYPGAPAYTIAATVAALIERQVNGVEGMVRIESTSADGGKYVAHVQFKPKTDLKAAAVLVQNRVNLALPKLPDEVKKEGVSVTIGKIDADKDRAFIAIMNRADNRWERLEKAAAAVEKRLKKEGAITEPTLFPRSEKKISISIDNKKCARAGVALKDVPKAVIASGSSKKIEDLKKVVVHDGVLLGEIATIKETMEPTVVYRLDLYPAIRISGTPPKGKSVAELAAKCFELAVATLNNPDVNTVGVINLLTGKLWVSE